MREREQVAHHLGIDRLREEREVGALLTATGLGPDEETLDRRAKSFDLRTQHIGRYAARALQANHVFTVNWCARRPSGRQGAERAESTIARAAVRDTPRFGQCSWFLRQRRASRG